MPLFLPLKLYHQGSALLLIITRKINIQYDAIISTLCYDVTAANFKKSNLKIVKNHRTL